MTTTGSTGVGPVKVVLWVYFWLLFFEGVLRKWVLPAYSDPLFVVRDPVALLAYVLAFRAGVFPGRPAMIALWLMTVLALVFASYGDSPLLVTLFGLRTNFLHLPLVFVMGLVFDREDVLRFGRWLMLLTIPILLLMIAQFHSEPDALVNVGVGGIERGQLHGSLGKIRPPGPFSFIASVGMFLGLTTAFILHGWMQREGRGRVLIVLASIAVGAAVPISISRSALSSVLVALLFALLTLVRDPRRVMALVGPLAIGVMVLGVLSGSVYLAAFGTRWDEAIAAGGGGFESNIVRRTVDGYLSPFHASETAPLLGHGVGLGTVAGAKLATGKLHFLLAEDELARCVLELGPILGFAYIAWRLWLGAYLLVRGWRALTQKGDMLPWLIAGTMFPSIFATQLGPATQLGFVVFGGGLALAALNNPEEETEPEPEAAEDDNTT